MKLPKGVKRLKASGSRTALQDAIGTLCASEFNGYVRASAPEGVKEACILLFLQSIPQLAVYQSPDRSVYGAEALSELVRIAQSPASIVRAEAFFTHDLVEVDTIVTKMRKAAVTGKDLAAVGLRLPAAAPAMAKAAEPAARQAVPPLKPVMPAVKKAAPTAKPPAPQQPTPRPETPPAAVKVVPKVVAKGAAPTAPSRPAARPAAEVPEDEEEKEEPEGEDGEREEEGPGEGATKGEAPAARPGAPAGEDDEEFLKMLKEVGLAPSAPGGSQAEGDISGDEIDQYIAAFETYIDKSKHPEAAPTPAGLKRVVQEIIDEMASAAGDDEWTRSFIESQRDVVLDKVQSSSSQLDAMSRQHDRLTDERTTLSDISKTFQDVLRATEEEARKHKQELDEIATDEGVDDGDWLRQESTKLAQQADRMREMEGVLASVLATHQKRVERIESELEETEDEARTEVKREIVDLESLKKDFLEEMRDRIRSMSTTPEGAPSVEGAAKATQSVSEGIHDRVQELEHERTELAEEGHRLEAATEEAKAARDTLAVDDEVEVRARIVELEDRETALKSKEETLLEMEERLATDRAAIEEELTKSRAQQTKVRALEADLKRREEALDERELELEEGRLAVEEAEARMKELKAMEARLKAHEMQLVARESEIDEATKRAREEREGAVEADIKRVEEMEKELRRREKEYSKAEKDSQRRIEDLEEELGKNRDRIETLEGRLGTLQKAEEKAKKLEAAVQAQKGVSGGIDEKELKRILAYLDDLLAQLPEDAIQKFGESEYFELYDKILKKLGI